LSAVEEQKPLQASILQHYREKFFAVVTLLNFS